MHRRGLRFRREVPLPEKALHPIHGVQLLTYLRLGGFPVGLLLNFDAAYLGGGAVRRVVNRYVGPKPGDEG
ncbi:MAG TPA: GxxExxY protein [Longimicrobiales bacterium]|nr:GxxExxY protein [Longimicrobiales bacterium]